MRNTSIQALRAIESSGLLEGMRLRVYRTVFERGPFTGRELDQAMAVPGETRTSYHKRLIELARMGVVEEVGRRTCSVTGMRAIVWDVNDKLPVKYVPPKSKLERLYEHVVKYGSHVDGCLKGMSAEDRCSCGFEAVLKDFAPKKRKKTK